MVTCACGTPTLGGKGLYYCDACGCTTIIAQGEDMRMFAPTHDWYKAGMPTKDFFTAWKNLEILDPRLKTLTTMRDNLFMAADRDEMESQVFQFWTKEYVDGLAEYIKKTFPNAKVVEVGAGSGELTKCLVERGINCIATDDFTWKLTKYHEVNKGSYKQAIRKYKPDVVLSSWMPYTEDWTWYFRKSPSVKGYIVIGEGSGGCCGDDGTHQDWPGWEHTERLPFDLYNLCRSDYWFGSYFPDELHSDLSKEAGIPSGFSHHSITQVWKRNT